MPRGRFSRDPGSGALIHHPTRHPIDRRGGGTSGGVGGGGGGTGDITNGANVNVRGIGVFHTKSGDVLQFRGIDTLSAFLSASLDVGDAVIDLDFDDVAFIAALPDFARRDVANTFIAPQTIESYLDLEAIADPSTPDAGFMRLFVRITGTDIELVSRGPTGEECILCTKPTAIVGGGTLLFNGIEP